LKGSRDSFFQSRLCPWLDEKTLKENKEGLNLARLLWAEIDEMRSKRNDVPPISATIENVKTSRLDLTYWSKIKSRKMGWKSLFFFVAFAAFAVTSPVLDVRDGNGQKIQSRAPEMPVIKLPSGSYRATYYDKERDVRTDISLPSEQYTDQ
jgi:hypothetical protein